jgi:hypothetical protein
MIELATAAVIAKLVSDAVGAFDKIFRAYMDVLKGKQPTAQYIPPPDLAFRDSPQEHAFVAQSRSGGGTRQSVTYQELCKKLDEGDRRHIETLTRAMANYQRQWDSAYEQRSMASGMEIGRLDAQLEYLARQIADPLVKVLEFVEKMGLYLDDHYMMARNVTKEYLQQAQPWLEE